MRQETFDDGTEHGVLVVSFPSRTEPEKILVRVMADGVEIAASEASRGEALQSLAFYFESLSRVLLRAAYTRGVDDATTPEAP